MSLQGKDAKLAVHLAKVAHDGAHRYRKTTCGSSWIRVTTKRDKVTCQKCRKAMH